MPRLDWYLRAWARWVRSWRPALGAPPRASHLAGVEGRGSAIGAWDDLQRESDESAMRAVDAAVDDLEPGQRAAIRAVYLGESYPERVTRAILATIEPVLLAGVRRRGVLIG